ncbi:MAG: DUF6328 family protein [Dehalococcoidia bacterium]
MTDNKAADAAEDEQEERASRDVLIEDYRAILNELALLTTVSVLLFGFLLGSSTGAAEGTEQWIYAVAMVAVASATMVFILPVAYHHVQFPYEKFDKFVARSHLWIRAGLPLLAGGLYLSLCLAIWSLFDIVSLAIAAIPFVATVVAFALRKGQF